MVTALDQTFADMTAIVGAAHVSTDEQVRAALSICGQAPRFVVFPSSAEEVAATLHYASEQGLALIPCRNGTKLSIGNPPRRYDIALSLKDLNRVWHYEPEDLTISVEPGMKFGDFQQFVGRQGLWLPLDPAGGARASVGGILAANASGSLRTHYGTARDMTLGMKIATTEGKIVKAGGRVVKNVAGYDLTKLMIGSFGTLGVIVEASFKLFPLPSERATLVMTAKTLTTAREIRRALQASPVNPIRLAFLNSNILEHFNKATGRVGRSGGYEFWIEVGGIKRVLARCEKELQKIAARSGEDLRSGSAGENDVDRWRQAEDLPLDVAKNPDDWLLKVSLPMSNVEEFAGQSAACLEPRGKIARMYADPLAGIVRLWLHAESPGQALAGDVLALRGAAIGLGGSLVVEVAPAAGSNVDAWGATGDDFEIMRRLKELWDPKGILSPGRFLGGL